MLVLTRRIDESITLTLPSGEEIKIMVVSVNGNQVRIGFDAPDDVIIAREELLHNPDHEKNNNCANTLP